MKKFSAIIIAMALVLGMSQCKKQETPTTNNTPDVPEGMVYITVNVDNGGGRHHIEPSVGAYAFTSRDKLYVGNNGQYVGTLEYQNGAFSGYINEYYTTYEDHLHFYFLGGAPASNFNNGEWMEDELMEGSTKWFTVNIADQSDNLPVLAYGCSAELYNGETGPYTTTLRNKCALVKFELRAGTFDDVTVSDMLTEATINFADTDHAIVPTETTDDITLYSESKTKKWAILLPQDEAISSFAVNVGSNSYTVTGSYSITNNGYINSGIVINNTNAPDYLAVGKVIGYIEDNETGSISFDYYNSMEDALNNYAQPIAMVAYVGDDYNLAIELQDANYYDYETETDVFIELSWNDAMEASESMNDPTYGMIHPDGSTWRIPTREDWEKMGEVYENQGLDFTGLISALTNADCMPLEGGCKYWTSTGISDEQATYIDFDHTHPDYHTIFAHFFNGNKTSEFRVRHVLQFSNSN